MVTARKPANILRQPEGGWLGLSGSAQHAATSGEVKLRNVPRVTVVFPNIVKLRQGEREQVNQHLKPEWNYLRNAADGIYLNKTTLGSGKLVHWVCRKCPKGQLHQYQMRPFHCVPTTASGCPYCAGKQVCECNSLQAHYPVISSEWDFAMNDSTPADVTFGSNKVV